MKVRRHGGGQKGGFKRKGCPEGGISAKFHLAVTTNGRVAEGFFSGGNVGDIDAASEPVKDAGGCFVLADKGCDSDGFRRTLEGDNNIPLIPGRKNRKKETAYDREKYKKRGYRERIFGNIKENRRLTARYEKSDMNFLGFILVAFMLELVKLLGLLNMI
jgi:transposase